TALKVVIDEWLDQPVVVRAALLVAGHRPDVVDKHAIHPRTAVIEVQHDHRRPEPPVPVAELRAAVGWDLTGGARAPDPIPGGGRRQECGEHCIADAVLAVDAWAEGRIPNHRHDRACDDV